MADARSITGGISQWELVSSLASAPESSIPPVRCRVPIGPGGSSLDAPTAARGQTFSRGEAVIGKGSERDLSEVKLKKGEPIDRALRRLKKKVDRENTLKDVRTKRHYEKPSERRRRKLKVARFSAMLSARYADL